MHATSTQPMADHRTAAKAALAAIIFAAGVALGAVVGTIVAPLAAPASVNIVPRDPDAPWFRQFRDGESGIDRADRGLRDHRGLHDHGNGEMGAGGR